MAWFSATNETIFDSVYEEFSGLSRPVLDVAELREMRVMGIDVVEREVNPLAARVTQVEKLLIKN